MSDDTNDTTGQTSNFFNIGTVKTVFNADITADVDFTIPDAGYVNATVGPLLDTSVQVPAHSHLYVTGITDGNSGDPLIAWNVRGSSILNNHTTAEGLGYNDFALNQNTNAYQDGAIAADPTPVVSAYLARLGSISSEFEQEWNDIANQDDLETLVTGLIQTVAAGTNNPQSRAQASLQLSADTWWPSPFSQGPELNELQFVSGLLNQNYDLASDGGTAGTGARNVSAVIDTRQKFVRIDSYTPPALGDEGTTVSNHSHLITLQPVTDITADYSYGNSSGSGNAKEGLGAAQNQINVTFNQSEVGMELNPGVFTLNTSIKKPIPDVVFSPNRTVPLVPEFHKVKYLIKAF